MNYVDALLNEWADGEDGSIFAPRAIDDVHSRIDIARVKTDCRCGDSSHENAIHDLVADHLPVLLRLIETLAPKRIETYDELMAVPIGGLVRSSAGSIAARFDTDRGVLFGDDRPFKWLALRLPAVTIPIPEPLR